MRLAAFAFAFFSLLTTAASAAPYVLCDLPLMKAIVTFDIGLQRFRIGEDGWFGAEVMVHKNIIYGTWEDQYQSLEINFKYKEDQATFRWDSPSADNPVYGPAFCEIYEEE